MLRFGLLENEWGASVDDESTDDGHSAGDGHAADDGHGDDGHADGHGDGHEHNPLDKDVLLDHVKDATYFEYSGWLTARKGVQHLDLPQPIKTETAIIGKEGTMIQPLDFKVTKFMVIEVFVAIVLVAVFVPLARKIQAGGPPKGRFWNLFEVLLVYVRNEIARPLIGKDDGDKYTPFLWTIFFFALFCNLFGLIPFMGSPTGALATTAVMALATFGVVVGTGVKKMGAVGFVKAQLPHMDLSPAIGIFIKPMVFVIELVGLFMKHFVLALRLFANMFAGHLILAVLLGFIALAWGTSWVWMVAPVSLGACVAINMLELFVAFLQAYIFTFLSALFIGAAAHPH